MIRTHFYCCCLNITYYSQMCVYLFLVSAGNHVVESQSNLLFCSPRCSYWFISTTLPWDKSPCPCIYQTLPLSCCNPICISQYLFNLRLYEYLCVCVLHINLNFIKTFEDIWICTHLCSGEASEAVTTNLSMNCEL